MFRSTGSVLAAQHNACTVPLRGVPYSLIQLHYKFIIGVSNIWTGPPSPRRAWHAEDGSTPQSPGASKRYGHSSVTHCCTQVDCAHHYHRPLHSLSPPTPLPFDVSYKHKGLLCPSLLPGAKLPTVILWRRPQLSARNVSGQVPITS